jgi:hypothetical protein
MSDYDNAPTDPHHGGKIWLADLIRAKEMLAANDFSEPQPLAFRPWELHVLGYEKADDVKPGDRFTWQGREIVVY